MLPAKTYDRIHWLISVSNHALLTAIFSVCALALSGQTGKTDSLPQYLFRSFTRGVIKMKNGPAQSAVMNYNTLTERMVFEQNGKLLDMINLEKVDTVYLQNARFIPAGKVFYEVLVKKPVSLFVQHKSELKSLGRPAAYGTMSQTTASTSVSKLYIDNGTYNLELPEYFKLTSSPVSWIRKNGIMYRFLTERQFLKIFPEYKNEIQGIIDQENLDIKKRDDLIKLVNYCNDLNQK
jgi:hypothetical protein